MLEQYLKKHSQKYHRSRLTVIIEEIAIRSWWVVIFCLICYAGFEKAMEHQNIEYHQKKYRGS